MNRDEYLQQPEVKGFLKWLRDRFEKGSFHRSWFSPKWGSFACDSLWDAYCKYEWNDKSFDENERELDGLRKNLEHALRSQDRTSLVRAIDGVQAWGHTSPVSNQTMDAFLLGFQPARTALRPADADLDAIDHIVMNALFSKVYHLVVDDFPIYDSRVGAALGDCVRLFLDESKQHAVPLSLTFGRAAGRRRVDGSSPQRNPSAGVLKFPRLEKKGVHARSNLMSAWLFKELAALPCFDPLKPTDKILAVESAFFMIGYDLNPAK